MGEEYGINESSSSNKDTGILLLLALGIVKMNAAVAKRCSITESVANAVGEFVPVRKPVSFG